MLRIFKMNNFLYISVKGDDADVDLQVPGFSNLSQGR